MNALTQEGKFIITLNEGTIVTSAGCIKLSTTKVYITELNKDCWASRGPPHLENHGSKTKNDTKT